MSDQEQARPPVVPITALGLLTIVAYGACYYAYGVLIQPISADSRWPDAALGAIFSAILVVSGALGIVAGRVLAAFLLAAVRPRMVRSCQSGRSTASGPRRWRRSGSGWADPTP